MLSAISTRRAPVPDSVLARGSEHGAASCSQAQCTSSSRSRWHAARSQPQREARWRCCATSTGKDEEDVGEALDGILDSLRRDGDYMRRRAERQAEARQGWVEGLSFRPASIQQADRPPPSLGERVKESIDKALYGGVAVCFTCIRSRTKTHTLLTQALIADFFFILVALAWFAAGLGVKAATASSVLLDLWLGLWPTLFQPALGILMAGALLSGLFGWLQSDILKAK